MEEDPLYLVIKEQLSRIQDRFDARSAHLEEMLKHQSQISRERISSLLENNQTLRVDLRDHETRIRALTDSATTSRTWQSLFTGGATLTSIAAFLRAFFGG
jgi:predicted RNase H-like nuclease (RuvC/YqgF family)